jgi:hypothetical protein
MELFLKLFKPDCNLFKCPVNDRASFKRKREAVFRTTMTPFIVHVSFALCEKLD